jgi:hypothetical protein
MVGTTGTGVAIVLGAGVAIVVVSGRGVVSVKVVVSVKIVVSVKSVVSVSVVVSVRVMVSLIPIVGISVGTIEGLGVMVTSGTTVAVPPSLLSSASRISLDISTGRSTAGAIGSSKVKFAIRRLPILMLAKLSTALTISMAVMAATTTVI